ncbi:MAG: response regulator [Planctomycetaceae bacterium]
MRVVREVFGRMGTDIWRMSRAGGTTVLASRFVFSCVRGGLMRGETVGRPMEILLVEDSLPAARITMAALKRGGIVHRLTWLSDGAEAVRFIHREGEFARAPRPDLILLDLMLPGRDGREILADLRQLDDLKNTPVVIMTGTSSEEQARWDRSISRCRGFWRSRWTSTSFWASSTG